MKDRKRACGLCITYNYVYASDFGAIGTAPISIAVAEALQRCATVAEAVDWIGSRPRWGAGILMMADAAGDMASFELSNSRSQVRRSQGDGDVLFHTNAFFTQTMQSIEVPQDTLYTNLAPPSLRGRRVHESANVRDLRFNELLKGDEPLSPDQLARIMADHETGDKPGDTSICTHSDYCTTATLQFFPTSRRMRVAFNCACRAEYTDIAL